MTGNETNNTQDRAEDNPYSISSEAIGSVVERRQRWPFPVAFLVGVVVAFAVSVSVPSGNGVSIHSRRDRGIVEPAYRYTAYGIPPWLEIRKASGGPQTVSVRWELLLVSICFCGMASLFAVGLWYTVRRYPTKEATKAS